MSEYRLYDEPDEPLEDDGNDEIPFRAWLLAIGLSGFLWLVIAVFLAAGGA